METETLEGDRIGEILEQPPTIELRASGESRKRGGGIEADILISTFYDLEETCDALKSLVRAIENKEETFDVREHNQWN